LDSVLSPAGTRSDSSLAASQMLFRRSRKGSCLTYIPGSGEWRVESGRARCWQRQSRGPDSPRRAKPLIPSQRRSRSTAAWVFRAVGPEAGGIYNSRRLSGRQRLRRGWRTDGIASLSPALPSVCSGVWRVAASAVGSARVGGLTVFVERNLLFPLRGDPLDCRMGIPSSRPGRRGHPQ
jgi:hypothetical protein